MNRRTFLKVLGAATVGACAATSVELHTNYETSRLVVERIRIPARNLRPAMAGFRIVHLSDWHLYPFTQIGFLRRVVEVANSLKPDLIALTGDYVWREQVDVISELAPILAGLNAKYGVFTILGNHDLFTNGAVIKAGLEAVGLPVLKNQGIALGIGKELIYLAGLDDGWHGRPDLRAAMDKQPGDIPTILLIHEPDLADAFSFDGRVSLQLSGHSHGGQIRFPGIGPIVLPHYAKKYIQGLYQVKTMWVYTTRGIGVISVPARLNCPPEITEITLVDM